MMTIKALLRGSLLPVAISVISVAQSWPLASGMEMATSASGSGSLHDHGRSRAVFLSGKVVVDEGMPLSQSAAIEMNCGGRLYTEGYTDAKGLLQLPVVRGRQSPQYRRPRSGDWLALHTKERHEHPGSPNKVTGLCSLVFWFPLLVFLF